MINVDPAFSVNAFGQLVFFGCELMPEPSAPKRPVHKKKSANFRSRSDLVKGCVIMKKTTYQITYYDSWSDTYERSTSFETLSEAEREVSCRIKSHDPDVTAYYIEWVEDGIPYEIRYFLTFNGWERD